MYAYEYWLLSPGVEDSTHWHCGRNTQRLISLAAMLIVALLGRKKALTLWVFFCAQNSNEAVVKLTDQTIQGIARPM